MVHTLGSLPTTMLHATGLVMLHLQCVSAGSASFGRNFSDLAGNPLAGLIVSSEDKIVSVLWVGDMYGRATDPASSVNVNIEMIEILPELAKSLGSNLPFSLNLLGKFIAGQGKEVNDQKFPNRRKP